MARVFNPCPLHLVNTKPRVDNPCHRWGWRSRRLLRLADALIEADKDFDLLIMPNQPHGLGNHPYFTRRRWDYFVRHLLEVEAASFE